MTSKYNRALETLKELANLRDEEPSIGRFLKKHMLYFEFLHRDCIEGCQPINEHVLKIRDEIRELWRGGERANEIAQRYLISELLSQAMERLPPFKKENRLGTCMLTGSGASCAYPILP